MGQSCLRLNLSLSLILSSFSACFWFERCKIFCLLIINSTWAYIMPVWAKFTCSKKRNSIPQWCNSRNIFFYFGEKWNINIIMQLHTKYLFFILHAHVKYNSKTQQIKITCVQYFVVIACQTLFPDLTCTIQIYTNCVKTIWYKWIIYIFFSKWTVLAELYKPKWLTLKGHTLEMSHGSSVADICVCRPCSRCAGLFTCMR